MIREPSGGIGDVLPVSMRKQTGSASSLRPVGMDVRDGVDDDADDSLAARRRRLQGVVVAAVSVCGLILVAAAGTQVARASAGNASNVVAAKLAEPPPAPPGEAAPAPGPAEARAAGSPATGSVAPVAEPPPPAGVGKVRIRWPALPGHVWLDGERIPAAWQTVSCGKHEVRVGTHGRAHPVDVPCDGEVQISR